MKQAVHSISKFDFGDYQIFYKDFHFPALLENCILDVYRSSMIRRNDVVVDIGAGIGEFSVMASRKVGKDGLVVAVEPNSEDFDIMKMNIEANSCSNIISLNIGLGREQGERNFTFYSRKFSFRVRTLREVCEDLSISNDIDFMKMDIEGAETEIIHQDNIDLLAKVNAIAIEIHDTKVALDKILYPLGFSFRPITMGHIRRKILANLVLHPFRSYEAYRIVRTKSSNLLRKAVGGLEATKDKGYLVGTYTK